MSFSVAMSFATGFLALIKAYFECSVSIKQGNCINAFEMDLMENITVRHVYINLKNINIKVLPCKAI